MNQACRAARARCLASCWLLADGSWSHFVPYRLRYTIVTSLESLQQLAPSYTDTSLCRLEIDLFVSMRYLHDLHVIRICANLTHAYISDIYMGGIAFPALASWCVAPRWNFVAIQCAASPCTLGRWTRISPGPLHVPERSTRCTLIRILESLSSEIFQWKELVICEQ